MPGAYREALARRAPESAEKTGLSWGLSPRRGLSPFPAQHDPTAGGVAVFVLADQDPHPERLHEPVHQRMFLEPRRVMGLELRRTRFPTSPACGGRRIAGNRGGLPGSGGDFPEMLGAVVCRNRQPGAMLRDDSTRPDQGVGLRPLDVHLDEIDPGER